MPITITLYEATNSSAQFGFNTGAILVGGIAEGLTSDQAATKETAFHAVLAQLAIQKGIFLFPIPSPYPADAGKVLTNVLMTGLSADAIRFQLRYENPTIGGVSTAIVYEMDSAEQAVESDKYPISGEPIQIRWTGRSEDEPGVAENKKSLPIEAQSAFAPYTRTITTIAATILRPGTLDESTLIANSRNVNVVNDALWFGRPAGCWKMSRYRCSVSPISGSYSVQAMAWTKSDTVAPFVDHRRLIVLESRQDGRRAIPDIGKIRDALEAPYVAGPITENAIGGTIYDPDGDGFLVDGPYKTRNFANIWSPLLNV